MIKDNLFITRGDFEPKGQYAHIYEQWLEEENHPNDDDTWQFFVDQMFNVKNQDGTPSTIRKEILEKIKEELLAELKERYARKIAAFIYASAVLWQEENNYFVYQSDIEQQFNKLPKGWADDEDLIEKIMEELGNYPGLDDNEYFVERDENHGLMFDLCLWTDHIASDYNANEDEDDDYYDVEGDDEEENDEEE